MNRNNPIPTNSNQEEYPDRGSYDINTEQKDRIMKALFGLTCLIDFYMPKTKPLSQGQVRGLTTHLWKIYAAAADLMPEEEVVPMVQPTVRKFREYCEMNRRQFWAISFPGSREARKALGI